MSVEGEQEASIATKNPSRKNKGSHKEEGNTLSVITAELLAPTAYEDKKDKWQAEQDVGIERAI